MTIGVDVKNVGGRPGEEVPGQLYVHDIVVRSVSGVVVKGISARSLMPGNGRIQFEGGDQPGFDDGAHGS